MEDKELDKLIDQRMRERLDRERISERRSLLAGALNDGRITEDDIKGPNVRQEPEIK